MKQNKLNVEMYELCNVNLILKVIKTSKGNLIRIHKDCICEIKMHTFLKPYISGLVAVWD